MLEQIPFLQSCEDEDSDEDDELDSVQHKKQRVKVRSPPHPLPREGPPALCAGGTVPPPGPLGAVSLATPLPR